MHKIKNAFIGPAACSGDHTFAHHLYTSSTHKLVNWQKFTFSIIRS